MSEIAPRQQIRRFDVPTEWNRIKAHIYCLAVAKVVAGRARDSRGMGRRAGVLRCARQLARPLERNAEKENSVFVTGSFSEDTMLLK